MLNATEFVLIFVGMFLHVDKMLCRQSEVHKMKMKRRLLKRKFTELCTKHRYTASTGVLYFFSRAQVEEAIKKTNGKRRRYEYNDASTTNIEWDNRGLIPMLPPLPRRPLIKQSGTFFRTGISHLSI